MISCIICHIFRFVSHCVWSYVTVRARDEQELFFALGSNNLTVFLAFLSIRSFITETSVLISTFEYQIFTIIELIARKKLTEICSFHLVHFLSPLEQYKHVDFQLLHCKPVVMILQLEQQGRRTGTSTVNLKIIV